MRENNRSRARISVVGVMLLATMGTVFPSVAADEFVDVSWSSACNVTYNGGGEPSADCSDNMPSPPGCWSAGQRPRVYYSITVTNSDSIDHGFRSYLKVSLQGPMNDEWLPTPTTYTTATKNGGQAAFSHQVWGPTYAGQWGNPACSIYTVFYELKDDNWNVVYSWTMVI